MAKVTLHGNAFQTNGELPATGKIAIDFALVNKDLATVSLENYKGSKLILNIFPSIDTPTCATSVREFNKRAAALNNTKVLCISRDLPFAQKRFCGAEGINNVENLSDFRTGKFSTDYGIELTDGPLKGLSTRAIVVLDENHNVLHTELVSEIGDEPNYDVAINAL
jgi:thiol peroxidase